MTKYKQDKWKMSSKKKYDFIVPIGWGCLNAHNLRQNNLQKESLPFDWIWIPDLPIITNFLKNNFADFMKKENLIFIRHNGDADIYRDTLTRTEFWHDFMIDEPFDKSYERNNQKYQRRINRLFYHINHAHSVLWVRYVRIFPHKSKTEDDYMFENGQENSEQLIKEFKELQNLYPDKKFDLLLIYTYDEPHDTKKYTLTPQIQVCEISNPSDFGWKGNESVIKDILQYYDLNYKSKIYYAFNTIGFKFKKNILGLFSKKHIKKKDY